MGEWGTMLREAVILVVGTGQIAGHIPKTKGDTQLVISLSSASSTYGPFIYFRF